MRPASVGFQCPEDAAEARRTTRQPRTSVGATIGSNTPVVTYGLIALNLIVYFVCGAQAHSLTDPTRSNLFYDWVMQPATVYVNDEYYRMITSAFLHLSPVHIVANMLSLVIIGPPLERLLGRWRFASIYLLAGLGGSVAIYLFGDVLAPVGGASGAIFGLFGACLVMVRRLGLNFSWLAGTIVINFIFTFSVAGISKLAHIGGFIIGVLAALVIGGWPTAPRRINTNYQALGLVALLALMCVATGLRTGAGMSLPMLVQQ
ncbi:MAG TPA: rhomboid family intramembrane serine protease [Jatrophihabitans sp.]|jgi:membrane associated rhomboid family serine protease